MRVHWECKTCDNKSCEVGDPYALKTPDLCCEVPMAYKGPCECASVFYCEECGYWHG